MPEFWEYPLLPHDYLHYWFLSDPKSNDDKVKSYKFQNFVKNSEFGALWKYKFTIHLLKLLDKIINMKWIQQVLLKIQSGHNSIHRQTDGWMDGPTSIPPFNFIEAGIW